VQPRQCASRHTEVIAARCWTLVTAQLCFALGDTRGHVRHTSGMSCLLQAGPPPMGTGYRSPCCSCCCCCGACPTANQPGRHAGQAQAPPLLLQPMPGPDLQNEALEHITIVCSHAVCCCAESACHVGGACRPMHALVPRARPRKLHMGSRTYNCNIYPGSCCPSPRKACKRTFRYRCRSIADAGGRVELLC